MLDGTIVVLSILSLAMSGSNLQAFKSFRTLRVMRPLRLISRNEGMKLVVNAFFKAIPAIANVIFVSVLVFLLFGVVGVSFFKGSFNSCQGTNAAYLTPDQQALLQNPIPYSMLTPAQQAWGAPGGFEGVTSKVVCEWLQCVWWPVIPQSFDNIGTAFVALFSSCTVRCAAFHVRVDVHGRSAVL
jgi:Ion transport protein